MLFFSNSISYLGDVLFDTLTEQSIEKSDLLENESGNEDTDSLEEEEDHVQYDAHCNLAKKEKRLVFFYSSLQWENHCPNKLTEPPETAV